MKQHNLNASRPHHGWDYSIEPQLEIDSGDTVVIECQEGNGGQMTSSSKVEDLQNFDMSKLHTLTGPIFVRNALPGDTLEVAVQSMAHQGWGYTVITEGVGLLADEFTRPYLHHWRLENNTCIFKHNSGILVPYEPFCGIMGVAPSEKGYFNTLPPRSNGGNFDVRSWGVGSAVWFPVCVPGGLFSVGDCHAAQGEGEVCGTAIECPMTVSLRFTLRKDMKIVEPRAKTGGPLRKADQAGYYVTSEHGPDLLEDARIALRYMLDYLQTQADITREEAYVLASAVVDLHISQIVNVGNYVVSAYLPLSIFHH